MLIFIFFFKSQKQENNLERSTARETKVDGKVKKLLMIVLQSSVLRLAL